MRFTTPVELSASSQPLDHDSGIIMLGSCFTDRVGAKLTDDGFDVAVNPMGILFNPASLARIITRAINNETYTRDDLFEHDGIFHCLDWPSKWQDSDAERLLANLNAEFAELRERLMRCNTYIITFGTAWVFHHIHQNHIVGNCHKLPAQQFVRRRLEVDEIVDAWAWICRSKRVIFTVSPVRHLADGLHGNTLSKSTLMLAVDQLCRQHTAEYFPAFEIVNDELRDYRFYAADMKHPSDVTVDYIYDRFSYVYFTPETQRKALEYRRATLRQNHRPIL